MSTDTLEVPLLDKPRRQGYAYIEHHNSRTSRRRGLCGFRLNHKTGQMEWKESITIQTIKHPEGGPLPHIPLLVKRNKYMPHVGKKQLAKAGNW